MKTPTFNEQIARCLDIVCVKRMKYGIPCDHIYQKYGAEMAVSISGDDIKTITRYYADPAQPNIGAIRIIDLL